MQYQIKFVQQTFISLWQLGVGAVRGNIEPCPAAGCLAHPKTTGADTVGSHFLLYMEGSFQPNTSC